MVEQHQEDWKRIEEAPQEVQDAAARVQWLGRWRAQVIGAIDSLYLLWCHQPGNTIWYTKITGPLNALH
jgi:hypothetical protein